MNHAMPKSTVQAARPRIFDLPDALSDPSRRRSGLVSFIAAQALALTLWVASTPARSEDAPAPPGAVSSDEASPAAASTAAPTATVDEPAAEWNSRAHRPRRAGVDSRLRLLTAELKLDTKQQAQVRHILEDQRALTLKAWSDESVPSAVRVKTTQTISEQTADRIRAVLNDKQREKYIKPIPPEARPATTTSANVENYIDATQRK